MNPLVAKNFAARLFAKSFAERLRMVVANPVGSWQRLRQVWFECVHPNSPLLVPKVIEYLARNIRPEAVGFEWGSGASTLWFARRSKRLVSIEHENQWFRFTKEQLRQSNLDNVEYRHVELDHDASVPTQAFYVEQPRYVAAIGDFEDGCFDFCLIDGHYRQACIRMALPKVSPGGLLIVDDTHWLPLEDWGVPPNWDLAVRCRWGLKETCVWKGPQ